MPLDLCTLFLVIACASPHDQTSPDGLWFIASTEPSKFLPPLSEFWGVPGCVSFLSIQDASLLLQNAPYEVNGRVEVGITFYVPDPEGTFDRFLFVNSPLVEDPKFGSEYATFVGIGVDEPTKRVRISLTPRGLHALVIGEPASYMVERAFVDDASVYTSHYVDRLPGALPSDRGHDCGNRGFMQESMSTPYSSSLMKQARIAIVARPAFVNLQDQDNDGIDERLVNTKSYIQDIVSDMAIVYEIDFGLVLVQVAEPYRTQIIYIDPNPNCFNNCTSDPYCVPCGNGDSCDTCENRRVLDDVVGFSRYDIGHMFSHLGSQFAPGLATNSDQFPLIDCDSTPQDQCVHGDSTHKARSKCTWANLPNFASYFWVDFVAHEIGHTLGAEHTFNVPSCGEIRPDAYEPGSGSTIMAYGGSTCGGSNNYVSHSDPYFHTATISRVRDFIAQSSLPLWPTANAAPVCNAGNDYKIPKLTPFELKAASASDPNGDALTYCWEQIDLGTGSNDLADKPTGPLFRSYLPTASITRLIPKSYFDPAYLDPNFEMSERLTSYDRDLNFRLTVRDGYGGVAMDSMLIDVVTQTTGGAPVGPFVLTFPNAPMSLNGQITVTWNPANTDAPPISCTNVSIQLARFTNPNPSWETLVAATANDGSAAVNLPVVAMPTPARIRVRTVNNIFLDAGDANFTLIPPM